MGRPPALAPHGGTSAPLPPPRAPAPPPPRALTGLAQARLGHGGGRGAPPRPVSAEAGGAGAAAAGRCLTPRLLPPPQVRPGAAPAPLWARPLLLKVLLWAVLLALFAELELGLPYFVLSLLYWMYAGTRGPAERRPGELSAYSVFNPGCAAIAGTLTAEQLERELHYRPAAGT
ncbi:SAYSvFN domain-containing protein 1 [Corvus kubaryi]|uniref:SAYSvFN domain-containing protein 1 n=1 Tax=Corvus kubaryi TaxID=68294 RepID=UPI001C053C57|nr:SAYSvFN domain-containing protein 1 [Corvus kubaryi]